MFLEQDIGILEGSEINSILKHIQMENSHFKL